ncbi:hypothetical protein Bca4012_053679 [Brassica carinata]
MQPIFHAILQSDLPAFLSLVEERDSLLEERTDEEHLNNTVLHMAAKLGHGELVSKIIDRRPSLVCSRNAEGNTPLHLTALRGDVNIVMQMLETGLEACTARNNNNDTPLHLACRSISMEAAKLIAEKTNSVDLGELNFAISSGSTCVVKIILERFPELAREEAWPVQGCSLSTLLHHACDRGDLELARILLGLDQRLDEALNTNGLSPLRLAIIRGSVGILEEFLNKAPSSFLCHTQSKETVFHLAARNKNMDAFVLMAERLGSDGQFLLQQTDENGNTVLHTAASVACGAPFIRYIIGKKIVDINNKNKMGFAACHLLPQDAQDFELISSWLKFDTETSDELDSDVVEINLDELDSDVVEINLDPSSPRKPLRPVLKSSEIRKNSHEDEVLQLLRLIGVNTSEMAERKVRKEREVGKGRESLEYDMYIEALQNARNTITIVAVLIASVAYAGGINPPGGVYQDGPWRGKSLVGKTTAFKVFAICNNIALFTSLGIVILLVSIIPYKRKPLKRLLVATHRMMWVSIGFMATAYVAASWVTIPHYHGTRWLFPAIVAVAGGALAVLFSYLGVEAIGHWFKKKRVPSSSSISEREINAIVIMEPQNEKPEEGERTEEAMEAMGGSELLEESKEKSAEMSRKEKRKAMKKLKRKQVRKEIASKEREEAEAKLNDPAEQEKLREIEEEEERKREKELKEFEESERAWREAMEIKRKKEEEEERRWKELEESRKLLEASRDDEYGEDEDGEYEYIEEGPPEIIFKGNEIILRKNKVRVLKKTVAQVDGNEIADRPTSNPLPPGTEAMSKSQNVSSAQQILDSVAQEVPNFGTEQDKAHCPFHLKTGACRFGPRCSRVHFYPDKSCTILMKNMYNGPGIAWEQDEGLEVCRNGSFHLKGNVYVHYRSVESALLAYQSINGRYFAGKQVNCEFVNISRWKVAICGEYMKSRLKTCSRGSACNFIHCFRNPGGDYEWADYDKPPPRFWIRKMTALFGYSDEYLKHMEHEYSGSLSDVKSDQPSDSQRQPSRRSRSREHDHVRPSYRSRTNHSDTRESRHKLSRHAENRHGGDGTPSSTRDGSVEREIYNEPRYAKETSRQETKWSEHSPGHRVTRKRRIHGRYSDDDDDSGDDDGKGETSHKWKSSRPYGRRGSDSEVQEGPDDDQEDARTHRPSSDRRSRKEDGREGSSADQEESHAHDTVGEKSKRERSSSRYSHEGDSSESRRHRPHKRCDNDRKRSVETSPRDKDRDKSKQRHRYNKTGDPDSDRRRKGRQGRESQEVNRNGKRENVSGSSSDDESSDTQKERSGSSSHRKRRRSHEQTPKEPEEMIERWRPM